MKQLAHSHLQLPLDDRKQVILSAAIKDYIETAEPVASKLLGERHQWKWSSATIRNELHELEQAGYLAQMHTSSGRVPTDAGYRLYVDALMHSQSFPASSQRELMGHLQLIHSNVTDVLFEVTEVMSSLVDYTIIVTVPDVFQETLKLIKLVLIDLDRILVVLLNSVGVNRELVIQNLGEMGQVELDHVSEILNRKLTGQPMDAIGVDIFADLVNEMPQYRRVLVDLNAEVVQLAASLKENRRVLTRGAGKMLKLPEFSNVDYVRQVMQAIEETRLLSGLFSRYLYSETGQVLIGRETECEQLQDCSLVMAPYKIDRHPTGTIGILGPKRMVYSRVVPMVKKISELISDFLTRIRN